MKYILMVRSMAMKSERYWTILIGMLLVIFFSYEIVQREILDEKLILIENHLKESDEILRIIENESYQIVEQEKALDDLDERKQFLEEKSELYKWKVDVILEIQSALQGMQMQLFLYSDFSDIYFKNELKFLDAMVQGSQDEQIVSDYFNVYQLYNLDASQVMAQYRMENSLNENEIVWQNVWNAVINLFSSVYVYVPLVFIVLSFGILKNLRSSVLSYLPKTYEELLFKAVIRGVGKVCVMLSVLLCCIVGFTSWRLGEAPQFAKVLHYNHQLHQFDFVHPIYLLLSYVGLVLFITLLMFIVKDLISIYFEEEYIPVLLTMVCVYVIVSIPNFILNQLGYDGILLNGITTFQQINTRMGFYTTVKQLGVYLVYMSIMLGIGVFLHKFQFKKLRKMR